ncbi:TetR/AcrR family transcriptional regulator [Nocardia sp. NBC_00565]|uniref:TetR family transcriptional regulator n=1 Tax=Nocardia sp. NBC_00565 TaxID=2975993 RepID=UPI002E7FB4E8|nr:TetR family transcriptional regulator [Nocardia sp. NBC_00565]WUC05778.1 TetR/AcrR family transcriptional regulator [Nocardia sp. NBC_00565]
MSGTARTRTIARAAVRADISQAAFELTRQRGFHNITVDDMAAAAGVSRSTLLRYFGSKEEAVLSAFDVHAVRFAAALRARPPAEDEWTALRRAMEGVVEYYLDDPAGALAISQLIFDTPALFGRQLEKTHSWRPTLTAALAARAGLTGPIPLALEVKAAAALDCLNIAVERWAASDGKLDLEALLDEGFDTLSSVQTTAVTT